MRKERFIAVPNLPEHTVTLAVVSGEFPKIIEALNQRGIQTIQTHKSTFLSAPVAQHADLQCIHLGGKSVLVARMENTLVMSLQSQGVHIVQTENTLEANYPKDVLLNAAQLGTVAMGKTNAWDTLLLNYYQSAGLKISDVKQGYTNCSVAIVSKTALITADAGIAASALANGLKVLQIQPGHITLPGLDYGFIGGCCGLISKNQIAFTGRLNSHPNGKEMIDFIETEGKQIVELTQNELFDIGGIIVLKELDESDSQ